LTFTGWIFIAESKKH